MQPHYLNSPAAEPRFQSSELYIMSEQMAQLFEYVRSNIKTLLS